MTNKEKEGVSGVDAGAVDRAKESTSVTDVSERNSPSTTDAMSGWTPQVHLFFAGLTDALAINRTIPLLVNHSDVLFIVLKIFGANGALILGSLALFDKGIMPFLTLVNETAFDIHDGGQYDSLLRMLFQSLWLGPICVLCYVCCIFWYQELADAIHKIHSKSTSDGKASRGSQSLSAVTKSIEYVLYATLAWLFVYVQVQLLLAIVPSVSHFFDAIVDKLIPHDESHAALLKSLHTGLRVLFKVVSRALRWLSQTLGIGLMSLLYAWYAFDPKWIAHQVNPDERFAIIEKHISYFLGFGLPSVLLLKSTSFFVGFGVFLMIFPIWIILGSTTDFASHYESRDVQPVQRYRVFQLAQQWTLSALKAMGKDVDKAKKLMEQQKQFRLQNKKLKAAAALKSKTN